LKNLGGIFDLNKKITNLSTLDQEIAKPDFWEDSKRAQTLSKERKDIQKSVEEFQVLEKNLDDVKVLIEIGEEGDEKEIETELLNLKEEIERLELFRMLGGVDDRRNAILTIHPGAGGTESCDWAAMLLRMYQRWIQRRGFEGGVLDFEPGDEAGIKDVALEVKGDYAYGYLKAESGVHRLVRISPFDANQRRHTSFASVFVYPETDGEIEIEIKDGELKMDTFRSSGPGGQNVNKVATAVRLTHIPSGIVVSCQTERSQHQNRENAMKIIMAKLYRKQKEEEEKKMQEMEAQKKEIEWGSQIRSYVFHPYSMVKDHRTNYPPLLKGETKGDLTNFLSWTKETNELRNSILSRKKESILILINISLLTQQLISTIILMPLKMGKPRFELLEESTLYEITESLPLPISMMKGVKFRSISKKTR
jgi:peptide chain release factor 2